MAVLMAIYNNMVVKTAKRMAWLLAMLMAVTACSDGVVYSNYEHTALAGWERNDTLPFSIRPLKESGTYALDLGLRTSAGYPFRRVTMIVEQKVMPSNVTRCDTVTCELTDDKGKVKGNGISNYQYVFHVSDRHYHKGDSLHISVRHDMKREILPGITDVGISLRAY